MLLEAVDCPIRYRLADGHEIRLEPGHPVDLPDDRARKLLAKAPGKVKLASICQPCLNPGTWIDWDSPLFGRLRGELLGVREDAWLDVFHPLTDKLARIPQAWVRQAR